MCRDMVGAPGRSVVRAEAICPLRPSGRQKPRVRQGVRTESARTRATLSEPAQQRLAERGALGQRRVLPQGVQLVDTGGRRLTARYKTFVSLLDWLVHHVCCPVHVWPVAQSVAHPVLHPPQGASWHLLEA